MIYNEYKCQTLANALTKKTLGPDKTFWQAGCGPWVVVWRLYIAPRIFLKCEIADLPKTSNHCIILSFSGSQIVGPGPTSVNRDTNF